MGAVSVALLGTGTWLLSTGRAAVHPPGFLPTSSACILIDHPDLDLGLLPRGAKKEAVFRLLNTLDTSLPIMSFRTECGCTVVTSAPRELPPHVPVEVGVSVDTTNVGTVRFGKRIFADVRFPRAEAQPPVVFAVSGTIDRTDDCIAFPSHLDIGPVVPGESVERVVFIHARKDLLKVLPEGIKVGSREPLVIPLDYVSSSPLVDEKPLKITFTCPPGSLKGQATSKIVLQIRSPVAMEVPVVLGFTVVEPILASPAALILNRPSPNATRLLIHAHDQTPLTIASWESDLPLECREEQLLSLPRGTLALQVKAKADSASPATHGILRIRFAQASHTLSVPITIAPVDP
jgi:hypothetical protein